MQIFWNFTQTWREFFGEKLQREFSLRTERKLLEKVICWILTQNRTQTLNEKLYVEFILKIIVVNWKIKILRIKYGGKTRNKNIENPKTHNLLKLKMKGKEKLLARRSPNTAYKKLLQSRCIRKFYFTFNFRNISKNSASKNSNFSYTKPFE